MLDSEAVAALLGGVETWNQFVSGHPDRQSYDFEGADLRALGKITGTHEFPKRANFSKCQFDTLNLASPVFVKGADFAEANIEKNAAIHFGGNSEGGVKFIGTVFNGPVIIRGGLSDLFFERCKFLDGLELEGHFGLFLCGNGTEVYGELRADNVTFKNAAVFNSMKVEPAAVSDSPRCRGLLFRKTTFEDIALFGYMSVKTGANYRDANFGWHTGFCDTVFHVAPAFHGAKFDPETEFDPIDRFDKQFPDLRSQGAEERYRTLKNLMAQHQALGYQLAFARLEQKAHANKLPFLSLHRLYGWLSDYGLSWVQPMFWLVALTAVSWVGYLLLVPVKDWTVAREITLFVSMSNAVPFVGVLKSDLKDFWSHYAGSWRIAVAALSIVQSVASLILLFLIGLGIRNRLRMK